MICPEFQRKLLIEKMATEGEKVEKEKVLPKDAQVSLHIFNERQTPKEYPMLIIWFILHGMCWIMPI